MLGPGPGGGGGLQGSRLVLHSLALGHSGFSLINVLFFQNKAGSWGGSWVAAGWQLEWQLGGSWSGSWVAAGWQLGGSWGGSWVAAGWQLEWQLGGSWVAAYAPPPLALHDQAASQTLLLFTYK